jgi:hypothetical protein
MEINPFENRPLYEEEKVITMYDINAILNGYIYQYRAVSKWNMYLRWKFKVAVSVAQGILQWLEDGKPGLAGNRKETIQ